MRRDQPRYELIAMNSIGTINNGAEGPEGVGEREKI